VKCYICNIAFCGTETWNIHKIDQKYFEGFEVRCWRIMEISWSDRVINEEVLESRKKGTFYIKYKEGMLTGLVTPCVGAAC
jgi:hypothetical protein